MATVEALGRIPVGTPVDHIITDLAATQAKQQRNVQIAQLACPTLSTAASSGSYPKEDGWFGLDESDMAVKTDASVTGEDYPEMQIGATSQDFRVERDLIGSIKIADRTVADWSATTGQDYSAYAAQKAERIARDHFVKKAFALVGASGGYDSDNTRDPGDITSSTFVFRGGDRLRRGRASARQEHLRRRRSAARAHLVGRRAVAHEAATSFGRASAPPRASRPVSRRAASSRPS